MSNLHVGGGQGWARAKRAVACLMYIDNIGMNQIEKHLLQHTRDTSAAGNVRNVAARTRDVLDAVVRIAEYSGHNIVQGPASDLLALRLEMGLPTAALPLASKFGIHLTRGQYLMLVSNEVVDPAHLTSDQLKAIFGVDLSDSLIGLISR